MHITQVFVLYVLLLITRQTIQTISEATSSEISDAELLAEEIMLNDPNSSLILDENGNPRDKRALGVLLQGLVSAFGYNATPVQYASLPNPNTIGTMAVGPVSLDVRQARPPVSPALPTLPPFPPPRPPPPTRPPAPAPSPTPSTPRQRETLRFTGVFNFGNNSDILGHLRQYEQLFHGSTTTARPTQKVPNPAQAQPSAINPRNAQTRSPLLEPYFVPIPIPLSPNIQNLQDLQYPATPLVALLTSNSVPKNLETTPVKYTSPPTVQEQEQKDDEEDKTEDSDKIIDGNTDADEGRKLKPVHGHSQEDSDKNQDDAKNEDTEDDQDKGDAVEGSGEEPAETEDDAKKPQKINQADSSENEPDHEEHAEEDASEEEQSASQKLRASKEPTEAKKASLEDAEDYIPNGYTIKLPIEDKPFHGPFMNSYGQSLEHFGKIDGSVADYFQRFKNSQSGLFDAQSLIAPQVQKRPWWIEAPRTVETVNDYRPLQPKYEEYNLNRVDSRRSQGNLQSRNERKNPKKSDERIEEEESRPQNQKWKKPDTIKSDKIDAKIVELKDSRQPKLLPLVPFDFGKYIPYYKPVQYFFSPESLERSAQSILMDRNSPIYRKLETSDEGRTTDESPTNPIKVYKLEAPRPYSDDRRAEAAEQPSPDYLDSAESEEEIQEDPTQNDETPAPKYYHLRRPSSQEASDDLERDPEEPIRQQQHYEDQQSEVSPQDSEAVKDYSEESEEESEKSEEAASRYDVEQRCVDKEPKPSGRSNQRTYVPVSPVIYRAQEPNPSVKSHPREYVPVSPLIYRVQKAKPTEPAVTEHAEDEPEVTSSHQNVQQGPPEAQKTNVPTRTLEPVTYRLRSNIRNDERQNTIPRGRVRYGFPDVKNSADDATNVRYQYLPYSENPAVYHMNPIRIESRTATNDYIFGKRIEPSLQVRESDDKQNYNIDGNKSSGERVSRLRMGERNLPSHRFFSRHQPMNVGEARVAESVMPSEFKRASELYKSQVVSGRSRGGTTFEPKVPDVAARYY